MAAAACRTSAISGPRCAPTGEPPPHFNRLEIRICDIDQRPPVLLAITAFIRVAAVAARSKSRAHDPLRASSLKPCRAATI